MIFCRFRICFKDFIGMVKVFFQIMYGSWKIASLPEPRVTIFGGARLGQKTKHAQDAFQLARKFVQEGISVITGGGSGIMSAANCGVISKGVTGVRSIGIGVKDLDEAPNQCVQEYIELEYFFARKWLFTRHSRAFIAFPGGYGTVDEIMDVLTLMQTKKLDSAPIVLVGSDYWNNFILWLNENAFVDGLISKEDLELFKVADNIDEIFSTVCRNCKK